MAGYLAATRKGKGRFGIGAPRADASVVAEQNRDRRPGVIQLYAITDHSGPPLPDVPPLVVVARGALAAICGLAPTARRRRTYCGVTRPPAGGKSRPAAAVARSSYATRPRSRCECWMPTASRGRPRRQTSERSSRRRTPPKRCTSHCRRWRRPRSSGRSSRERCSAPPISSSRTRSSASRPWRASSRSPILRGRSRSPDRAALQLRVGERGLAAGGRWPTDPV